MNLLHIPREVWQSILLDWIGTRNLIRLDCALSHMPTVNPLLLIYAEQDLSLVGDNKLHAKDLMGLSSWTKARRIKMRQLGVLEAKSVDTASCEDLFTLSAESLKKLVVDQTHKLDPVSNIIVLAAAHCVKLESLSVYNSKLCPGIIGKFLQSNAATLHTLNLETLTLELGDLCKDVPTLSNLQVLRLANMSWTQKPMMYLDIEQFIYFCPNITAFSLHMCRTSHALLPLLSELCPKITRLHLMQTDDVNDYGLFCMLTTNPNLVYLEIIDCPNITFVNFGAHCARLAKLHTLVADNMPDDMIAAIATERLPSLRIFYLGSVVSYDQVRAITAAHPQLTSFGVLCLQITPAIPDPKLVLEHCKELRHLTFFTQGGSVTDVVLISAAMHCIHLHTLDIRDCGKFTLRALNFVLQQCKHIRRLHVPQWVHAKMGPGKCPHIKVTSVEVMIPLDDWMPADQL